MVTARVWYSSSPAKAAEKNTARVAATAPATAVADMVVGECGKAMGEMGRINKGRKKKGKCGILRGLSWMCIFATFYLHYYYGINGGRGF